MAQTPPGVPNSYRLTVNLRRLTQHRLRVRVEVPPVRGQEVVFALPKTVPGIYGALNFGQYVADLAAFDGRDRPLAVTRQDVNSWHIAEAGRLHHLTYTVGQTWGQYHQVKGGQSPAYRAAGSSYHPDSVFVLNYGTFVGYFVGEAPLPYEVQFVRPTGFYGASYLTPQPLTDSTDVVKAANYHELIDAPVLYARPDTAWLQVGKTRVLVALYDEANHQPQAPALARSLRALLEAQRAYLGGTLPVDKYSFLVYHTQSKTGLHMGEGLEHNHSTLILQETVDANDQLTMLLHVAAHEFFHVVTPLNIHSQEIEDYDFRNPRFSAHLWFYEGLTEYETIHMPICEHRETLPEFLAVLSGKAEKMSQFNDTLALTQLSRQALTRQDQYPNFYLKGALFNLCLDVKLRELSGGKMGTQELVQKLLRQYGAHQPFQDNQLFAILTQLSYPALRPFFRTYLEEGHPLPLAATLRKVGLMYNTENHKISELPTPSASQLALRRAWIGQ